MFNFCPHCGKSIGQEMIPGQLVKCRSCGKPVGTVGGSVTVTGGTVVTKKPQQLDATEEKIRQGLAGKCPLCQQVVDLKEVRTKMTFVPHYRKGEKKICPQSGKVALG